MRAPSSRSTLDASVTHLCLLSFLVTASFTLLALPVEISFREGHRDDDERGKEAQRLSPGRGALEGFTNN